ncbi:hypothetical protein Tco_0641287 [Tanacetum coccineum]
MSSINRLVCQLLIRLQMKLLTRLVITALLTRLHLQIAKSPCTRDFLIHLSLAFHGPLDRLAFYLNDSIYYELQLTILEVTDTFRIPNNLGLERGRVVADLTPEEKERYKADICATNILLQGLPKDIYTLINHYTDAKDIWDNVKMLLEGFELTKDERKSPLYDDFEHFRQNKGETIHEYYVRAHSKTMYSLKETIEFRILQGQDAIDASSGEWSNLALNKDHVFQADQCDAFGSDVDEAPTAQTMFMENLFIHPTKLLMKLDQI